MEDNDELSQLDELLRADVCEELGNSKTIHKISDINIFQKINNSCEKNIPLGREDSVVHKGDTDSSDDDERRNYTERKFNDYGSMIKLNLDQKESEALERRINFETRLREVNNERKNERKTSFSKASSSASNTKFSDKNVLCAPSTANKPLHDLYTDPIFGIRISKPLLSSSTLLDRMQGREAVSMLRVKRYVENEDLTKNWVIAGVIVRKSSAKKSQKGNQFIIWTLSDLKDDLKTVSVFLFRKAYNDLWKSIVGTVVAILNPNVLDKSQNSTDQACLSVENSERIMIIGTSKDLGTCKSRKKNGEPCTAFVNLSQCEHCIYHIKQEYQKFSKRQELQSSTMGKGLQTLQNKVFGKNTFIYGGKSYSALPPSNQKIIKDRDQNRLMSLSDYYKTESDCMMNKAPCSIGQLNNNNTILHSPTVQKMSDSQRLNNLNSLSFSSSNISLAEKIKSSPTLGFGLKGTGTIDLNISYSQKASERAKNNAIKLIQKQGGIAKLDPNNIKGTDSGKKRALDKLKLDNNENNCKKRKMEDTETNKPKTLMTERFKKILEATSAHENLIKQHEDNEQEKYFNKLEKKEAMEEKMLNTFKLACKAVRCIKCKYTAFSAAQRCKDERHPLKVLDTFKRFFKCADCNNRTVSLELLPLHSCKNCNSSRWEKAPMMREKKVTTLADGLSIRGEEETFMGGHVTAGKNINLLVPENT